jgi:hypothetical protein
MNSKAAVLYGKEDIRIRDIKLPEITKNELLVKVITNSICLSTYKASKLGSDHKRVPEDIKNHPPITGHEFAGIIVQVGENLQDKYQEGAKFVLQPAMGLDSGYSAGYSYEFFGGNSQYCIISKQAIDLGCVLEYHDDYFANASLAEPMSCIIGAFHATYHTTQYVYSHQMGIKENGKLALLGCCGPMGIGAIDYAVHGPRKPKLLVVTDIDDDRINRAKQLITIEDAKENGVELHYFNTSNPETLKQIKKLTNNKGYDDVFVFAAIEQLINQANQLLGNDGCLNFFAGPTDKNFNANFNFYNVHYESTHIVGTSGGSTSDMEESLTLSSNNIINPSYMITHIGGLDAVAETIINLPFIKGGKKLIYPYITLPLVAIKDFDQQTTNIELFKELTKICKANNNVWNRDAEVYLLKYFKVN